MLSRSWSCHDFVDMYRHCSESQLDVLSFYCHCSKSQLVALARFMVRTDCWILMSAPILLAYLLVRAVVHSCVVSFTCALAALRVALHATHSRVSERRGDTPWRTAFGRPQR